MTVEERHNILQKRLEVQRERILRQKERALKTQTERILKQRNMENKRAVLAHNRGEEVTGIDELERRKVSAESRWISKWDRRRAKWEHRTKK